MSGDFLATMAASSRARVEVARATLSEATLLTQALNVPAAPRLRLSPRGFDLIAEVKLRSPAAGQLKGGDEDVAARVIDYAEAGATAISVLTEPSRFDGALEHLRLAVRSLAGRVPAMRKDFIVDPYQVIEACAAGAGGVLVILRMLSPAENAALIECATRLGLFVLLEAFDEQDLAQAQQLLRTHGAAATAAQAPLLVGINCRDLSSLQVVPGRLLSLAAQLPRAAGRVAESGVESEQDVRELAAAGYDLALIGSSLMRAAEPRVVVRALLTAGREAAQQRRRTSAA